MTKSLIEKGRMYFDSVFNADVKIHETTKNTVCVLELSTDNKHLYGKEDFAEEKNDKNKRFIPK